MLTAFVVACLFAYVWWHSRKAKRDPLANSWQRARWQQWYLRVSPLPLLVGVVIPLVLNLATHFAIGVRKTNILLTEISVATSAMLVLVGGLLIVMNLRHRSGGVPGLVFATIVAGIPLLMILFYGGASWIVTSFPNR